MNVSDKAVAMLAANEGIAPAPYRDSVGVWTYGVGHTAAAGAPDPATMPRGMPDDLGTAIKHALRLFRADLQKYADEVSRVLTRKPSQHQFDAMVLFHYNTGAIARAKVTQHFNAGDDEAAAKAFMGWTKPPEIIPRRKEQQRLFAEGIYALDPVNVWNADNTGKVIWKPVRKLTPEEAIAAFRDATPEKIAAGAGVGGLGVYAAANGQWWLAGLLCAVVVGAILFKKFRK